jgi:hypothetical protein
MRIDDLLRDAGHDRERDPRDATSNSLGSALCAAFACALIAAGCGDKEVPPPPPCDSECADGIALRALRESMKYAFNMTLQKLPVGVHDVTTEAFISGSARVHGSAFTDAQLGATTVDLTYEFSKAAYFQKDNEPKENFIMVVNGTITQKGTIAVQPSSPTSLLMKSESMYFGGQVYDPLIEYVNPPLVDGLPPPLGCPVELNQNGSSVAGRLCGNFAGFEF